MTISKAYHGESETVWYLLDDDGDPIESTSDIATVNLWGRYLECEADANRSGGNPGGL